MQKAIHALNMLRFAAGSQRPITGPAKATWEVTYRCNMKCKHCHLWQVRDHDDLTTDEAKKFIRELGQLGTMHLSFSGGEPFLRNDIFELASYARECGMTTGVNTNGTRIATAESARQVCEAGFGDVFISLDSSDPNAHNALRGNDRAYDLAVCAIQNLMSQRTERGPRVFINTTVNGGNVDKLDDILSLAKDLGIDGMTMSVIQSIGKYSPENGTSIGKGRMHDLSDRLCALAAGSGGLIPHSEEYLRNFQTYLERPNDLYKYRCVAGYATALVHPNGDVQACPVAFASMGNLRESSFAEVWYSKEADNVRRRIKMNDHPICWFDCIAPLTVFLHNIRGMRIDKVLHKKTLQHILAKIKR